MQSYNIICNYPFKNHLLVFMMMVLSFMLHVEAQDSASETMPDLPQDVSPSKVVILVALSIMITLTFILLAYVRLCRTTPRQILHRSSGHHHLPDFQGSMSRLSGMDRQVIETLPFFKFSSLKGSKQGLECTVCLSQFEETEILRLLPKCKHAFHMNCIDKWLESHSSCPLCRSNVDPLDIKNFTYSISSRFLQVPSDLTEDTDVEIFVQREPSHQGSSRFNVVSNKEELQLLIDQEVDSSSSSSSSTTNCKLVHKFNHKIVISNVVTRSRWSDLNSSDMLSLKSEMLDDMSRRRFSPLESTNSERFGGSSSLIPCTLNEEENSFPLMNPTEKRSMSEIARVPRFVEISKQNRIKEAEASSGNNWREERLRRIWFPIAQRTVQLFATQEINSRELEQEINSRELEHKALASNV